MVAVGSATAARSTPVPTRAEAAWGAPSPFRGPFPRIGPVTFKFYTDPNKPRPDYAQSDFTAGYPTKVVLSRDRRRAPRARLMLRGFDCATGMSLRFWYREGAPPGRLPASKRYFERVGTLAVVLPRGVSHRGGYMLFTEAGRWKLALRQGTRRVGALVVQVGD
jgi:hypothetical protein